MTALIGRLTQIQAALDSLARRHGVPGATLAISSGGALVDFATGVLNVETAVETTTDSVFQIGSNTKVFTATLLMQLVDSGLIGLDDPVRRHLPSFSLADEEAAGAVTIRHLLCHTSGMQGDHFAGYGRGDEAVARYVESLAELDLVHPVGEMFSYCNSGFVVAGRIAEVVTGLPYRTLLRERICSPLGLERTTVLTEETVARRCAVGHVVDERGKPVVPPVVVMEYAQAPAGSRTTSTAEELVRFVEMHVAGGIGPSGKRVLSDESAKAMRRPELSRPPTLTGPQWQGLGWRMEEWGGKTVVGHGGGTIGQLSFLQSIPEEGLVVALLTNATTGGRLWRDLGDFLFEELAGVKISRPPAAPPSPPRLRLDRHAGVYERLGVRETVHVEADHLVLESAMTGSMAELSQGRPSPPVLLWPIDEERFVGRLDGLDAAVVFSHFERGRPRYLFAGGRLARRGRLPARPADSRSPAATSGRRRRVPPAGARAGGHRR